MDKNEINIIIERVLKDNNIIPTQDIFDKLNKYYHYLIQYNSNVNLTAITEYSDVYIKHFADCIAFSHLYKLDATVCDIGTGAGFPGVVLKIIRPDLKVTLVDSLNKRVVFLEQLIKLLGLKDIQCLHYRAEDIDFKNRYLNKFDYVVARAVAQMPTLTEYCLPYVKVGGQFIAYKSSDTNNEVELAENCIHTLGGSNKGCKFYQLTQDLNRKVIVIAKIKESDKKYPRGQNKPRLSPIL